MDAIKDVDIKDRLVEQLRVNFFNITKACEMVGISFDYYASLLGCEYFQAGLSTARQCRDDIVATHHQKLIEANNAQAIIEYQKMLRQSDDKNEALVIRKKSMKYYIETAETKANVLRTFSDVFGESAKIAEKFYQAAMTEFGLLSPAQRKKEELKNSETKMSVLLEQGKLNELDMIRGLLKQSLDDAENAEYPSERAKASEQSIRLTQRKDEIEEKARREDDSDDTPIGLKVDAIMFQSSPAHVRRVMDEINMLEIKKIENA